MKPEYALRARRHCRTLDLLAITIGLGTACSAVLLVTLFCY